MIKQRNTPDNFLWVIRALVTGFLIGYLISIYIALVVTDLFPAEETLEDLLALGLLLLFGVGYSLMWQGREGWAAVFFIIWFAALWPLKILIGGERWEDTPVPGVLLLFLAVLLIVYCFRRRKSK